MIMCFGIISLFLVLGVVENLGSVDLQFIIKLGKIL